MRQGPKLGDENHRIIGVDDRNLESDGVNPPGRVYVYWGVIPPDKGPLAETINIPVSLERYNSAYVETLPLSRQERVKVSKEVCDVLVIDRFEGDWAVLELDGKVFNVPKALLPGGVKEGDTLRFSLEVDRDGAQDRRQKIRALEDRLFKE